MRALVVALSAVLLALPVRAAAAGSVSLAVTAGYDNYYRASPAWVPIRVTAINRGPATVTGTVEARGATDSSQAAAYSTDLVLPPATPKTVTLFVPGDDVQGTVTVRYREGAATVASASVYPNPFPDTQLVVGALTADSVSTAWLRRASLRGKHPQVLPLTPSTVDAEARVLANFDAIVVSNVDTSQLDSDQRGALDRFVRNGGTLIVVGGPDWQETVGNLPSSLIPGTVSGARVLNGLTGLEPWVGSRPRIRKTAVAVLTHVRGTVVARQASVPLVAQEGVGDGLLEYVAFDPADASLAGWRGSRHLFTLLTAGASPLSVRRVALSPADRLTSFLSPGVQAYDLSAELGNLQAPGMPVDMFLVAAALAGIAMIVGLFRFFRRPRSWLSVVGLPLAIVLCAVWVLEATPGLAERATLVNSVGVITLDGPGSSYPISQYVGLFAPIADSYTLDYPGPALVTPLYPSGETRASSSPIAVDEGERTNIRLGKTPSWGVRTVTLRASTTFPGTVEASLHLTRSGRLMGTIVNRTRVDLKQGILIAGQSLVHLGEIRPGVLRRVTINPGADVLDHQYPEMLLRAYGQPNVNLLVGVHPTGTNLGALLGTRAGLPPETTFAQRVRNAVNALPESNLLPVLGEVALVAWTDAPLTSFTVNGSAPRERQLTMVVRPITPAFPRSSFTLSPGTFGARVMQVVPRPPEYECCGSTVQPVAVGPGGAATFAYQLPAAAHLHFRSLSLHIYAGGIDPSANGYHGLPAGAASVYDWTRSQWAAQRFHAGTAVLRSPQRFVSATGSILLRLVATHKSGDLSILDPHADIQISGSGAAS
jgi:hypothetical protein